MYEDFSCMATDVFSYANNISKMPYIALYFSTF